MTWAVFGLSLFFMVLLARYNLFLAMLGGAFPLVLVSSNPKNALLAMAKAACDPGVLTLAVAVGLLPVIGVGLRHGGWLEALVSHLPGSRRLKFALIPAIFGLLPIPGGALLSAPALEKLGGGKAEERAAANVWFRHLFLSFYPLSAALITGAKLAELNLWEIIPFQLPWAALLALLGVPFLLRPFSGKAESAPRQEPWIKAFFSWIVLLFAPIADLVLQHFWHPKTEELPLLVALLGSFLLILAGLRGRGLLALVRDAAPWRFSLIIVGVFSYLAAFQSSGLPEKISALDLPLWGTVVGLGLLMGLATGRQQAALSVTIPVYLQSAGHLTPWAFSVLYQAAYLGYLLSPLHPCLIVSAEFTKTTLGAVLKKVFWPSVLFLLAVFSASFFLG
ncbi:DUF401 family protein [Candidatus Bipolaricaulota bacterium]|nr:DUF401 family protein [Candidatus Bipolaricaulota bacterium]